MYNLNLEKDIGQAHLLQAAQVMMVMVMLIMVMVMVTLGKPTSCRIHTAQDC